MKTLVTGGTGFVGSRLIDLLLARGHAVTALVRSPEKAGRLRESGVRLIVGDLANTTALRQATADQDVVFHVAAVTGARNETEFQAANRDGTANLIEAAGATGNQPRFILVSSAAAGGPAVPGSPRTDADDDHPVTMYGRSKLASEQVCRTSRLPWTILRPPTVFGPHDTTNLLTIFRSISRFGIAPVFGDGSQQLSLIHVDDFAAACLAAATTAATTGRLYYVNDPEVVTSRQLIERIGSTLHRPVRIIPLPHPLVRAALSLTETWANLRNRATILRTDKANEFRQSAWTGDPSRFISDTGWLHSHDLDSGLKETADWYRAENLL